MRPALHINCLPALLLLGLAIAKPASAQHNNMIQSGNLTVHYNALATTSLSPEVAHQYGITRSASRALLHVAVREGVPGEAKAVPAIVTAAATTLHGTRTAPTIREESGGEAANYMG